MAQAMEAFSTFVLEDHRDESLDIIENQLGVSAGELQGGSEEHEIYRISIDVDEQSAASQLLAAFHEHTKCRYSKVLTMDRLHQYMLGMCHRRYRNMQKCSTEVIEPPVVSLCNTMFILSFGYTNGQVRHIDRMDPNLQVCCYMSTNAPATRVYTLVNSHVIENTEDLLLFWGETCTAAIPQLLEHVMMKYGPSNLGDMVHTRKFSRWGSLDEHLKTFGKLYLPVEHEMAVLNTRPGTTLISPGNEVHAGPPSSGPRMFAFATGVTEPTDGSPSDDDGDRHDGEIQYNPVMLHIDLCCILFALMDAEPTEECVEAKRFLLHIITPMIQEYPQETYRRLLNDDRSELREWLAKLVEIITLNGSTGELHQVAMSNPLIFSSSCQTVKRRRRKKEKKELLKRKISKRDRFG